MPQHNIRGLQDNTVFSSSKSQCLELFVVVRRFYSLETTPVLSGGVWRAVFLMRLAGVLLHCCVA